MQSVRKQEFQRKRERPKRGKSTKRRMSEEVYCYCRKGEDGFMIQCDFCDDWFHGDCIGITEL